MLTPEVDLKWTRHRAGARPSGRWRMSMAWSRFASETWQGRARPHAALAPQHAGLGRTAPARAARLAADQPGTSPR